MVDWILPTLTSPKPESFIVVAPDTGYLFSIASTSSQKVARSIDGGLTWTVLTLTTAAAVGFVTVAAGGLVLVSASTNLYRSTDHGVTWSTAIPTGVGGSSVALAAISRDGKFALLGDGAASGATPKRSTDGGLTWTVLPAPANVGALNASISDDGQYQLLARATTAVPLRSADFGVTWATLSVSTARFVATAMSSDGRKQFGIMNPGVLYRSTDYGATWTAGPTAAAMTNYFSPQLACDPTGTKLLVSAFSSKVLFTSADSGLSLYPVSAFAAPATGFRSTAYGPGGRWYAVTSTNVLTIGTTPPITQPWKSMHVGSKPVQAVYFGSQKIWQKV